MLGIDASNADITSDTKSDITFDAILRDALVSGEREEIIIWIVTQHVVAV